MATYAKIINGLTDLGIHKMQEYLDTYIELVNKGEKSFSVALEELIEIEQKNNQIRAENACVKTAAFPFLKTMDDFEFDFQPGINKKELLSCIDRATLLVKEGDKKPIIINIGDELMELKIKSQIGSMNEEIMITKEGKDLLIGFNPKFLIDALRVIDDEEVTIYLMNAKAPCFIKDDAESYVYLILPVNFNSAA